MSRNASSASLLCRLGRGCAIAWAAVLLAACGGGGGGSTPSPSQITYSAKSGVAQKGPLIKGSTVTAQELDASLSPTGKQYTYQINSDLGTFSPTSTFGSQYIGLNATGYYFDELANALSSGPITLNGYADLTAQSVLNVNLLTTLAYQRIQHLVKSNTTFAAATTQAENEILTVFNIPAGAYGPFGTLDFAGGTDGDHVLVALSSLFVDASGGAPGNLSSLIANFQSDLAANGSITDAGTKTALLNGARSVNPAQVAANLTTKYTATGATFTASDISNWLDADGDGVIGKFKFQLIDAAPTSSFTFPAFVVNQVAGTSISATGGQLSVNGSPVNGTTKVAAGDVVSVSPGGAKFPTGLLNVYLVSGATRIARVQFISQLLSLAVTPGQPSIPNGLPQQFAAMGTFSDTSVVDITSAVAWTSATPTVATIAPTSGLAQSLSQGSTVITATVGTVAGTATLNVTPAVVESISVSSSSSPLFAGHSTQLAALGSYSDSTSADVTSVAQWTSNNPSVATVGPTTGLVQAVSAGSATITATVGSVSGTLAVAPRAVVLASIAVTPSPAYSGIGIPLQLVATGTFNDGSTADVTTTANWVSSTPAVSTIGATTGVATGVAVGSSTVSAMSGSITGSTSLAILANQWSRAGDLVYGGVGTTATLLPNGKVLLIDGGYSALVQLFDPIRQSWALVSPLSKPRIGQTATLLPDGKVLVVGGTQYDVPGTPPPTTGELYDPVANAWSNIPTFGTGHEYHTATLLRNGKVLVVGGLDSNGALTGSVDLYDPVANTWSAAAPMLTPRYDHTATLLQSNEVLIVGGTTDNGNGDISASTAEIYDPASNSWSQTGNPLAAGSMGQTTTLLQNGKVLHVTAAVAPASAEIYDPVGKTWSAAAPLAAPRYLHTATLLPNGSVLIVGGFLLAGISNAADITASTEIYDPVSNTWTAASALSNAREAHAATLLQNGVVLVEGGIGSSGGAITSSELYWFH